jgi:hypothetical protein
VKIAMEEGVALVDDLAEEILDLDAALDAPAALDSRKAQGGRSRTQALVTHRESGLAVRLPVSGR